MTPKCPTCNSAGRKVKTVTLESLLQPQCQDEIRDVQYYVCTSPDCETVYYDEVGKPAFAKSDLTVRFGLKEIEAPRPVCYCFDHTVEEIEEEIHRTGQSSVAESIKADMNGPGCRCEYTNPLGGCCLKTVQAAEAEALRLAGHRADAVAVGAVQHADCCASDKSMSKENTMSDCGSGHQEDTSGSVASAASCCQTAESPTQGTSHGDRAGAMAAGGSIVAAILSSACCWLPLLLIAFGASAAGVAGFFAAYRPVFLTIAVGLLGLGYFRVYSQKASCAPGSACATSNRRMRRVNQAMLWVSTALVGAFIFFPNYVGSVFGATPPPNAAVADTDLNTAVYNIEGMTCQVCADILSGELAKLPDVKGVKVDYDKKSAVISFDPANPVPPKRVIASVKAAGYTGTLSQSGQQH